MVKVLESDFLGLSLSSSSVLLVVADVSALSVLFTFLLSLPDFFPSSYESSELEELDDKLLLPVPDFDEVAELCRELLVFDLSDL